MSSSTGLSVDIELIAQRILKLAEIATLEHLETLARSQADGLMDTARAGLALRPVGEEEMPGRATR